MLCNINHALMTIVSYTAYECLKMIYHIASNYGWSHLNAWSHLVARGISIIAKINTGSRINAGCFVGPQS